LHLYSLSDWPSLPLSPLQSTETLSFPADLCLVLRRMEAKGEGITGPLDGANMTLNMPIALRAGVTDTDGNVTKVEFFRDGTKLGENNTAPYCFP